MTIHINIRKIIAVVVAVVAVFALIGAVDAFAAPYPFGVGGTNNTGFATGTVPISDGTKFVGVPSSTFYLSSNPNGYLNSAVTSFTGQGCVTAANSTGTVALTVTCISGNQTITFTINGDATGTASGATAITDSITVTGLNGKALPANTTGTLQFSGNAWKINLATSSLGVYDASGNLSSYLGSSCGGGLFVTGFSASGTVACGTPSTGVGPSTSTYIGVFDSSGHLVGYASGTYNSSTDLWTLSNLNLSGNLNASGTLTVVQTSTLANFVSAGYGKYNAVIPNSSHFYCINYTLTNCGEGPTSLSAGFSFDVQNQIWGGTYGRGGNFTIQANDPHDTSSTGGYVFFGGSTRGDAAQNQIFLGSNVAPTVGVNSTSGVLIDGTAAGHNQGYVGINYTGGSVVPQQFSVNGNSVFSGSASIGTTTVPADKNVSIFSKGLVAGSYASSGFAIQMNAPGSLTAVATSGGSLVAGTYTIAIASQDPGGGLVPGNPTSTTCTVDGSTTNECSMSTTNPLGYNNNRWYVNSLTTSTPYEYFSSGGGTFTFTTTTAGIAASYPTSSNAYQICVGNGCNGGTQWFGLVGTAPNIYAQNNGSYQNNFGTTAGGIAYLGSVNATPLQLQTAGTARLYITTGGIIGIGTTTPTYNLQVQSTNQKTALFQDSTSTRVVIKNGASDAVNSPILAFDNTLGNAYMTMGVDNGGNGGELTIDNNAQSPRVQVIGAGQTDNGLVLGTQNGGTGAFWTSGDVNAAIDTALTRYATSTLAVGANGAQGDFTGTLVAGKIGIGTASPSSTFHDVGNTTTTAIFAHSGTATTTVIEGSASSSVCDVKYTASSTAVYLTYLSSGQQLVSTTSCQ